MRNRKAAVIPSKGIGDALLMMIASHQLYQNGFEVITFYEKLGELKNWFPGHNFEKKEKLDPSLFDLIIVQNDNSPFITNLINEQRDKLSVFYPSYYAYKHAPLAELDQCFNSKETMADNIARATGKLIKFPCSKDNGIRVPSDLIHQKEKKRIVIHPTSSVSSKNWNLNKFIKVAALLKSKDYNPVFVVGEEEKHAIDQPFELKTFESLDQLASFIFESGGVIGNDSLLGHLGSNLNIPTVIVADNPELMALWRPGWLYGNVATPPSWIPHRIRKKWWRALISSKKVANYF